MGKLVKAGLLFPLLGLIFAGCDDDDVTTPDTTAPTVAITQPSAGDSISSATVIKVDATDDNAVASVEFFVDDSSIGTDATSPYEQNWDITAWADDSTHDILAKATDDAGNVGQSDAVTVTVLSGAPTLSPKAVELYVINVLGNTISAIDLETSTVTNDVAVTGTFPNSLVYRNGKLYLINSGSNDIRIFDVSTWQEETPIDVGAGNNPMNMVFFDDNTAYVSALLTNSVLKINMATKTVDAVIDAGVGTTGLALASGKIYATNTAFDGTTFTYGPGTVTVIDGASGSVVDSINVAMNPQSAAVAPDSTVHVVCTGNFFSVFGRVYVIDPATDTVTDSVLVQGSPGPIGISEPDNLGYLADFGKGALVYNTETYAVVNDTTNYFGAGGSGILVGPEGNVFISDWFGNRVLMLDKNGTTLNDFSVGDSPGALAVRTELK